MEFETKDKLPERKNIRLKSYDYSQRGFYFVTVCTYGKKNILGNVADMELCRGRTVCDPQSACVDDPWGYSVDMPYTQLTETGKTAFENFKYIHKNLQDRKIDCFCIMPNHVHFIVQILQDTHLASPTLAGIVRAFKEAVTKQVGTRFWQRNYYKHVIRNEQELLEIRKYILENPLKWALDKYYLE